MPEEKGTKVGMAGHASPITCVGRSVTDTITALILEGWALQHGFTLKPCLIWLGVRDGNSGETLLCSVATELESPCAVSSAQSTPCAVRGLKQGGSFCPAGRKCQGHKHPTASSRKEEKTREIHC